MRDERQAEEWDRREVVSAFDSETRDASAGLTGPRVLVAVAAIAIAAACAVVFGLLTRHASQGHAALGLRPVVYGSPPAPWAGSLTAAGAVRGTGWSASLPGTSGS
jgi:uncharacterized membrane protein YphA (DoxX/SURF4 family)